MEVAFEDGELELVLLDEANERELEASEATLVGVPSTLEPVPNNPAYGFLGLPGDAIYVLPQDEREGVLYLGIAGDEIPAGAFNNDAVDLNLVAVNGPGNVFLYATDAFGSPTKYYDSADGIGSDDVFPVSVGGHAHQNWAFTAAGRYEVVLQANGVQAGSGQAVSSEAVSYTFEVLEPEIFAQGELDMEVVYEDGEWELALLDEANERELEPDQALLYGVAATRQSVPADASYGFLGNAGDSVWVLPQEEQEGVLYAGIAGDEIESGVFKQEAVSLHLVGVRGPGNVSLYATDAFGAPQVFFNSGDGIDEQDVFPVAVGGHAHQNWAFTAPGVYKVDVQASGTLVGASEAIQSEVATFTFYLDAGGDTTTPEPLLFSDGDIDMEVAFEDGELELVLLDEANERELEASEATLVGVPSTLEPVPNNPAYGFLGLPGDAIYVLPQDEREGVLYLGIAGDEIPAGAFNNDAVDLNLVAVNGPGNVFLYATDAFGSPTKYYDSADGIGSDDVFPVSVGGHAHQNWAFTAAGRYEVVLQANGVQAGSGQAVSSEAVSYTFEVLEPEIFAQGELDMEVVYEDGEWELALLDEANERELEPDQALLYGVAATRQSVPADASYGFLGNAGDSVWVLPQEEQEGVLYAGIAGDEIESGVFKQEAVSLHLVGVRGPGNVSLYATDAFGAPQVFFNSGDGIDEQDVFPVAVGGHAHQNWAFTAPGVYKVDVQASGTLVGASEAIQSEVATFTFYLDAASGSLTITHATDGQATLSWYASPGVTYQLESKNSLLGENWLSEGEPVIGAAALIERPVTFTGQGFSKFFRVRQIHTNAD